MSLKDVGLKEYYISGVDNLVKKFYVPVLQESVLYQRRTAYFNSRALAMAARGLSGLLKNDGKMQLICSVQLEESDKEVFENPVRFLETQASEVMGMLDQPYDKLERQRLSLLAELLATGKLEIKVAMPHSGGIYHEKAGIFHDKEGNIVAFNGSGNETPGGWLRNRESFHVFTSWMDDRHIRPEIRTFDALWNHRLPDTTVIPLPEAVRTKILQFRAQEYFFREGMDEPVDPADEDIVEVSDWRWTPELAFVIESPRLWNHGDFAFGEVAFTPFEHQDYVASSVLDSWPPRCLLCDEVGLGKTIEAGLILKGFRSAGRVDRAVILAPKNILKQWQLQLLTKFNIVAWRLDGDYVLGPQVDPDIPPERKKVDADNPFRTEPIMLVSSQLIRSERRKNQLLGLEYDIVVLDEAHHARARGAHGRREPNLLLSALEELKLQTQGLIFMTATPIQLSRKELWDLLMILEVPGNWQDEDLFDRFFDEMNRTKPDWRFLFEMVQSGLRSWGVDHDAVREARNYYKDVDVDSLMQLIKDNRHHSVSGLDPRSQEVVKVLLNRHSPVYRMIYRNTRELLKRYHAEGKFKEKMAERDVQPPDKIVLTGSRDDPRSELGLYHRVDEYIREHYAKYESVRKGLGFLMEVYRKRLTSSFYAIKTSLGRRKQTVDEALRTGEFGTLIKELDEDEAFEEYADAADDFAKEIDEGRFIASHKEQEQFRKVLEAEQRYLERFLSDLQDLPSDSKAEYLHGLLRGKFEKGVRRVIVFSQFADTVDFLLNYFRPHYGAKLGSYTGEGGSYWDGRQWVRCSKQKIQEKFADDSDSLSILVCTDAASEGLDLQSCDTLVNYDIPWNPMRIEQRIGRIDRIGQKSPKVIVHTLYYEGTVEERVYGRCLGRIDNFKTTLGSLQPILAITEKFIREASLARDELETDDILSRLDDELAKPIPEIEENIRMFELLNHYEPRLTPSRLKVPVSQRQLEDALSHPLEKLGWTRDGEYWVRGATVVTFTPSVMDLKSRPARLTTPQSNLADLFGNLPEMPETIEGTDGRRLYRLDIEGLTAFVCEHKGRFAIVRAYGDLTGRGNQSFSNLEECRAEIVREMKLQKQAQVESQIKAWENRFESWRVRSKMYMDKVAAWRWRSESPGNLEGYDEVQLMNLWTTYLQDPDRKTLRQLVDVSTFKPDLSKARERVRGRPPKSSPRSSRTEDMFLRERRLIQDRINTLRSQP